MSDPTDSDPEQPADSGDSSWAMGPPSSSIPGVSDATPPSGEPAPFPPAPEDLPPVEGTAMMPTVPARPVPPIVPPVDRGAHFDSAIADDVPAAYVITESVPWYRQPGPRAWALVVGFALLFLIVALIIWMANRDDTDDSLIIDTSTTTIDPFATTTDLAPTTVDPLTTSTLPEPTTTLFDTTTALETTTVPAETTTLPPETTTTSTTTTTTTTTTTSTTTTTTTTVPPPPPPPEVVVPAPTSRVSEIIQSSPGLSALDAVMSSVGFYSELNAITEPFTFFAPTNEAIEALPAPDDAESVRELLRRHVTLDGRLGSLQLFELPSVEMLDGAELAIDGAERTIDGRELVVVDRGGASTDEVLHVIDGVLLR